MKAPKLLKSMYSFIYKTLTRDYLSVSVSYYMKSHTKHELKLGSGWDLSLTCSFSAVYRSERDHRGRPDGGVTHVLPGWRPAVPAARRVVPQPGQSGWTGGSDCGPLHTVSYRDFFFSLSFIPHSFILMLSACNAHYLQGRSTQY